MGIAGEQPTQRKLSKVEPNTLIQHKPDVSVINVSDHDSASSPVEQNMPNVLPTLVYPVTCSTIRLIAEEDSYSTLRLCHYHTTTEQ